MHEPLPLPSRWQGTLAPLGNPDYRKLLASNTLWWQFTLMEMLVVGWLALELTDSAWQVALVGFYRSLPLLLVGFFSGAVIDRYGRRKVIVACQATNLLVVAAITGLLWFERLDYWHLAVGSLVVGVAWALDWPARRALVPDLVGKGATVDAMLLENFAQNFSRILGPFAGGALIALVGATGCYLILTVLAGVTLLILLGLSKQPVPRNHMPDKVSPWAQLGEGLRYVRHSQPIMGVLAITVIMNFLAFPSQSLLPVFARDILGQGPVGLGLLGASSGIGSFVGLLLINRLRRQVSNGWLFLVGTWLQAAMLVGFALSSDFILSLTLLLLSGVGQACFSTMQSAIILITASDEMRSRTMGTLVLAIGSAPLGKLQLGGLAELLGASLAVGLLALTAVLCLVGVGVALPGLMRKELVGRLAVAGQGGSSVRLPP